MEKQTGNPLNFICLTFKILLTAQNWTPPFSFLYRKMNPRSTSPRTQSQIEENSLGLQVDLGHSSASPHPNQRHNCLQVPEPLWTMVSAYKTGTNTLSNSGSLWKSYARAPCLQQFNTKSRHTGCSQLGAVLSSPGSIYELSGNIPGGHSHLWVGARNAKHPTMQRTATQQRTPGLRC